MSKDKAFFVCCAVALALLCLSCSKPDRFQYSGTLQAESANVGSTIGGRVTSVDATDGQLVHTGQLLVTLDDTELRADLQAAVHQAAQAEAALAQAAALLRKTQSAQPHQLGVARENVHEARAGLASAQAQVTQQQLTYGRSLRLFAQGAIAAQSLDNDRAAFKSAQANVAAARASLAATQTQLTQLERSTLPGDLASAQQGYRASLANRQAARANVAAAQSRLREMFIRAPADGTIDSLDLRPGDLVGPRAEIASVREFIDPYVRIYVAQKDLGRISVGTSVSVRSDALSGVTFNGRVEQIDQDAQFTPRDVQTAEDRDELVFGVKVRVHDPQRRLHGGTTVEVALP
jgi:HlyD family secretion protein